MSARQRDMGPSLPWHMDDADEPGRVFVCVSVCVREREGEKVSE